MTLIGIVICAGLIGFAMWLLIDPAGYSKRYMPTIPADNQAVRKVLRTLAALVIVGAGYYLLDILRRG